MPVSDSIHSSQHHWEIEMSPSQDFDGASNVLIFYGPVKDAFMRNKKTEVIQGSKR